MNELQKVFEYQGSQVRTIIKDGEPWFVAADVCAVLELGNVSETLKRLDADEYTLISIEGSITGASVNVVNEPGLYSLILGSRKPEAREFKRWITHEVIPAIRRTGGYHLPQNYVEALRMLANEAERNEVLEQQNKLMAPKADQYDTFLSAKGAQSMNEAAKCLGTGRNRLFDFLRKEKVLMNNRNPYQEYIERGYFIVIEKTVDFGGNPQPITQTLVTPKGVDYIGKLLNRGKVLTLAK